MIRTDRRGPTDLLIHTWDLSPSETCVVRGIRVTTPARTAFDIARTLSENVTDARPRHRGIRTLRATMALTDTGAESPQESRVRLLLVRAGLPKPETQIAFRDRYGAPYIRFDMGWEQWKVAVEYDGVQHWTDRHHRSWDIDRIAILEAMGWTVVRVSAEMLTRPDVIIARVVAKLRAAGSPSNADRGRSRRTSPDRRRRATHSPGS